MVAEVVFPNTVPPFFPTGALVARPPEPADFELRLAGIRAHNRWLADWCARHPQRRAGIGQIFLNDVDDAIADVRLVPCARAGAACCFRRSPPDVDWTQAALRPLLRPAVGRLRGARRRGEPALGGGLPDYGPYPAAGQLWIVETTWFSRRPLTQMLLSGVFERFPRLRYVITESGRAWIPPLLAQLDGFHAQMKTVVSAS